MSTEKLQKVLARAGLGSRREMEEYIASGRVRVNRKIAKLGDRVTPEDHISVDKRRVHIKQESTQIPQILCYHKPTGEVCTRRDPERRPTVFKKLPRPEHGRWIMIGRLDLNTSGLLLFTTHGELANRLMHPSHEIEREYAVRVLGKVSDEVLHALRQGVEIGDGIAHFNSIKEAGGEGANHWYHVIIREGRNREVRRLWESQGVTVSRLIRIRFGPISLPGNLRSGHKRLLEPAECAALFASAGLSWNFSNTPPTTRKRGGKRR